jgi:hypothetical protein
MLLSFSLVRGEDKYHEENDAYFVGKAQRPCVFMLIFGTISDVGVS